MPTSNLRFRLIGEDDASAAFLRVAAASKLTQDAMNNLGSSTLGLTKMIGAGGLIPMVAGATAAVAELGTALGAAAGAGSVFGISVVGTVKQMILQQQAMDKTSATLSGLVKGTTSYKSELQKLHMQQQSFNQSFGPAAKGFDNLKQVWGQFLSQTKTVTDGTLAKGFNLVSDVLPKLVPVSNAAGQAVGKLVTQLNHWVDGPEFKALVKWLETSGPKDIVAFGHTIGYLAEGIGKFFSNFVGTGNQAAHTVAQLAKAFDKWAGSASTSQGINHFLKYVSDNGPAITSTLKSLAEAAPKIVGALGQIGSVDLHILSKFLGLVAGMPQKDFTIVADGLFAIAAGAKAVTIATSIGTLGKGALTLAGILKAKTGGGLGGTVAGDVAGAAGGKGVVPVYVTNWGKGGLPGGGTGVPGEGSSESWLSKLGKYFGFGGAGAAAGDAGAGVAGVSAASVATVLGTATVAAAAAALAGYIINKTPAYPNAPKPGTPDKSGGTYVGSPDVARGGQAALKMYGDLSTSVQKVSTRFQALQQHAADASRNIDLAGHSAQRMGSQGATAVDHFNSKLATIKSGPTSAALDLVGHSATTNFQKATTGANNLTGAMNKVPDNKTVDIKTNAAQVAQQADAVTRAIQTIPTFKTSTITIVTRHIGGQVFATGGHTVGGSGGSGAGGFVHGGSGAGASRGYGYDGIANAGPHLIDSAHFFAGSMGAHLLRGLLGARSGISSVQSAISSGVSSARSRYQAAVQNRNSFAAGFQNFATSIFGMPLAQDANGNNIAPTFTSILAAQKAQQQQAATVKADVRKLVARGLSPALLKQFQAGGTASLPELEALANASHYQIAQLNKANASTMGDLHSAGMTAGNRIYGQMIARDKQQLDVLREIQKGIKELVHGDKGDIHIHLEGQTIVESIRKNQRKRGVPNANKVK